MSENYKNDLNDAANINDQIRDLKISELLRNGATLKYREPTEEEKKDRILRMDIVLPGKVHDVDVEIKFTDE